MVRAPAAAAGDVVIRAPAAAAAAPAAVAAGVLDGLSHVDPELEEEAISPASTSVDPHHRTVLPLKSNQACHVCGTALHWGYSPHHGVALRVKKNIIGSN